MGVARPLRMGKPTRPAPERRRTRTSGEESWPEARNNPFHRPSGPPPTCRVLPGWTQAGIYQLPGIEGVKAMAEEPAGLRQGAKPIWGCHRTHHDPRPADMSIGLGSHGLGAAAFSAAPYRAGLFLPRPSPAATAPPPPRWSRAGKPCASGSTPSNSASPPRPSCRGRRGEHRPEHHPVTRRAVRGFRLPGTAAGRRPTASWRTSSLLQKAKRTWLRPASGSS